MSTSTENFAVVEKWRGGRIEDASIRDDTLFLKIVGGPTLRLSDNGQNCCEKRYMSTADNVRELNGQMLKAVELRETSKTENDYGVCEVAFVIIQGDESSVTLCTYNEHNGYYGGFDLTISEVES